MKPSKFLNLSGHKNYFQQSSAKLKPHRFPAVILFYVNVCARIYPSAPHFLGFEMILSSTATDFFSIRSARWMIRHDGEGNIRKRWKIQSLGI